MIDSRMRQTARVLSGVLCVVLVWPAAAAAQRRYTRAQEEQFHRAATRALAHGAYDEARELQRHVTPLAKLVTSIHGIPGLKAALSLIGYVGGRPRLPLEPVGDDVVAHIRRQIDLLSGETHL